MVGKAASTACQNAAALFGYQGYEVEHVAPDSQRGVLIVATIMALKADAGETPDVEFPLIILEGWA